MSVSIIIRIASLNLRSEFERYQVTHMHGSTRRSSPGVQEERFPALIPIEDEVELSVKVDLD